MVADGRVCVQYDQKENGRVLAIDAQSGQTVWEQKRTPGASWSSPVVVAGADGKRMLLVNGLVLKQGDSAAPELMLEEIGASASVFSYRGERFRVAH